MDKAKQELAAQANELCETLSLLLQSAFGVVTIWTLLWLCL